MMIPLTLQGDVIKSVVWARFTMNGDKIEKINPHSPDQCVTWVCRWPATKAPSIQDDKRLPGRLTHQKTPYQY